LMPSRCAATQGTRCSTWMSHVLQRQMFDPR
jgi:hypothetical protein